MQMRKTVLLIAAALTVAACVPNAPATGPTGTVVGQPVYQPPKGNTAATNTGSTTPPPKFDKDGNPNYDVDGNYIGGHGLGTLVDNPDADGSPDTSMPDMQMPDLSKMNCTTTQIENAGSMTCTN